jgi:hypothetical protein
VSGNQIKTLMAEDISDISPHLTHFSFSRNKIAFSGGYNVKCVIMALFRQKELKELDFSSNPFLEKDATLYIYFVKNLNWLYKINGKLNESLQVDIKRIMSQNNEKFELSDLNEVNYEDSIVISEGGET